VSTAAAVLPVFRIVAPEFGPKGPTRKSDDEVIPVIGLVLGWPTATAFGSRASEAIAELAAHVLTMQARVERSLPGYTGTGPVSSVGVRGAAFSHTPASSPANSHEDDALRQTTHGLAYLRIRDSRACLGPGVLC
jgi:hypothetical protein